MAEPLPKSARLTRDEVRAAQRIVALRKESAMTLRELGQKTGLSESYLSRVENLKTAISIANLSKVATAFVIPVAFFFEESGERPPLHICRKDERKKVRLRGRSGVDVQLMAEDLPNRLMEPFLVEITARQKNQPLQSHPGQEFIYILEGRCEFRFDNGSHILEEGDSLYFDADHLHGAYAVDGENCRLFSVVASEDYRFHGNITRLLND